MRGSSEKPMNDYHVLDAHAVIGRHVRWSAGAPQSRADLLTDLDHFGVTEALVLDCLSRECHPLGGNARIVETCASEPRLHPAWALLPPGVDEDQLPPAELLAAMRDANVGAAWLCYGQYHFGLQDWVLDDLLGPLAEAGVPLFVCPNDIGPSGMPPDQSDLAGIVELCRRWPDLPVILSEYRVRRSQRNIYRALDACENLRLELSGWWLHHGLEYITQRWGAERLIYGSNWPTFGMGQTLAMLTCADLDDADKRRIAGDNLRGLMSWCELDHPEVELPEPADKFVAVGRRGERPETMRFADNHGHLGGRFHHYHVPDGTFDQAAEEMERLGVDCCCVFSYTGIASDEQPGNDLVAAAQHAHPDRFIGFTLVNPHRGRDEMLAELERGHAMGLRGVKLIPHYQGYPPEGPNIDIACQWAHEHHQLILNHHWGSAAQMERLVRVYPNACFFTGHTTLEYAEVMRTCANLYVCSCPLLPPGMCERVVATIGADRFLFGSDLLDLPIAWGLGPILFARISPEEKQLVLGDNLRGLLEKYSL